ncbi:MAG TPA: hypothetical protein VK196_02210 [Magnetospirillum sp.]|nr:hypothetical protein [Magnetospirillum sp.]
MATLKDILVRRYGYGRDDFGSAGLVRLDCAEGTLSPVPMHDIFTPHRGNPAKVVRLAALFQAGQVLTLTGVGRAPTRQLTILMVSGDGLMAQTPECTREFLPWERLRHALMRPELLIFHDNSPQTPALSDETKKNANSLCTSPRLAL